MPVERGYERQVTPQAAQGRALVSPDVYGAGIGAAAGRLGEQVGRDRLRAYQIDRQATRDRELTEGTARVASYTVNLRPQLAKLKLDHPRGGADYDAAVHELLAAGRDTMFDGMTEQGVVEDLKRSLTDYDTRVTADAQTYSIVAGAKGQSSDAKVFEDAHVNGILLADDPAAGFTEMMEQAGGLLGGLSLLDADQRTDIERHLKAAGGTAWIKREAASNPGKAAALLPQFADVMTPQQVEAAFTDIALGTRRQEQEAKEAAAAAARQVAEAQEAARDKIKSIKVMIDNGDDPGNARIAEAAAAAKAAGLPEDELLAAGYLVDGAVRAKAAQSMNDPALRQRVRALEAAEGAGKLDADGRRELKDFGAILDKRDQRHGAAIEALDLGEAIGELRALPHSERVAVAGQGAVAARRVVMADLPDDSIRAVSIGAGARKDRPEAYMPKNAQGNGDPELATQEFKNTIGQRVLNSLGESYAPLLGVALDHYVGSQTQGGDTGKWDAMAFRKSVRIAFGGTKRPNGVYQGGLDEVRGRQTVLPDKLTAEEFDRSLSRLDFAKRGAIYGDGRSAATRDVMAHFRIMLDHQDDDGKVWYRFEDARGGALRRKGGGLFLEGFAG